MNITHGYPTPEGDTEPMEWAPGEHHKWDSLHICKYNLPGGMTKSLTTYIMKTPHQNTSLPTTED